MSFLQSIYDFIVNNMGGAAMGLVAGPLLLKSLKWAWEIYKPLEKPTEYAKTWAENKGRQFALFYQKRITDKAFRDKTINDLANSSNEIQEAFVKGLKSVE